MEYHIYPNDFQHEHEHEQSLTQLAYKLPQTTLELEEEESFALCEDDKHRGIILPETPTTSSSSSSFDYHHYHNEQGQGQGQSLREEQEREDFPIEYELSMAEDSLWLSVTETHREEDDDINHSQRVQESCSEVQ
jgi:hypothetical protein